MKTTTIFLFLCFAFGVESHLPPYIKKCSKNSKELNACIRKNIEKVKKHMSKGIPDLFIPKLEPYYVENLKGVQKPGLFAMLENTRIASLIDFQLNNVDMNLAEGSFKLEITFKKLVFTSTYTLIGQAVGVHFNSSGPINGELRQYDFKIQLKAVKRKRNGDDHFIFNKASYQTQLKNGGNVFLKGVSKDEKKNKRLNQRINNKINDFFYYINPALMKGIGRLIFDVVENTFQKNSLRDLFA